MMKALAWGLGKSEMAVSIFAIVGILRSINKPLMTFLNSVVGATPSNKDNLFLEKMVKSKAYKAIAYFLDWSASVKLPKEEKKK